MTLIWNPREEEIQRSFVPSCTLLKNVTRTGFLNPFDNQLYLGSNVFFSARYMTATQLFFLSFWQSPLSRRRTACSNDRIGSIETQRLVKMCKTILVAFKTYMDEMTRGNYSISPIFHQRSLKFLFYFTLLLNNQNRRKIKW